jgi:site-specific DNA recombinase
VKELPLETETTVETVVLLSRGTYPQSIEVTVDVDEGEVTEQPTYKRIQKYVEENYGFKVHTAYIAEVKRMCGLEMHKAPNAVEQRKHEYHACPPEKVAAIKDALRHFGLISE